MRITFGSRNDLYSGPWGFLAQWVVMTLAAIVAAWLLPGVHIDSISTAILAAAVIALLNNFIRPILIVITLPFTIFSMGFFLLVINAIIIMMASGLVHHFKVDGFWWALLFSLLLTLINYLLEIPNRMMRRPKYQSSDQLPHPDMHVDEEGFSEYEEIKDEDNQ